MPPVYALPCPVVVVVDGDSINCGRERLRLLGIDAPELSVCPEHRQCVEGDGQASMRNLERGVRKLGPFRFERHGKDRYGRTLVMAWAGETNLACYQIKKGYAVRVKKWDKGGLVLRACWRYVLEDR